MAPTKEKEAKEAKLTPEQSATLIMDYLRKQNRPYSATDISTNLKNRVTKAAAAKLLKDMHERKEIEGRASGKQIVYHTLQDEPVEGELEKLAEMDAEITRLRNETVALKAEEKELRADLRNYGTHVPLSEIKLSVGNLTKQRDEMRARLDKLQGGDSVPIDPVQRERINNEHRRWKRTAQARSKIRLQLWQEIETFVGKEKAAETKEELGLEF